MKIVCLVKQVPRADSIEFDQETKSLRREGVPLLLNPFDAAAVAHAAKLKRLYGGEVIAMTMGPPQAADALRTCIALGADRCIHLSDRVFAVADTLGPSRTLAMAIETEAGVDLVVCGNDKRFGQTGSPTRVLAVRDVTPARLGEGFSSLEDATARIRELLPERRVDPSSWTKPARLGEQPSPRRYDCWTFVELADG